VSAAIHLATTKGWEAFEFQVQPTDGAQYKSKSFYLTPPEPDDWDTTEHTERDRVAWLATPPGRSTASPNPAAGCSSCRARGQAPATGRARDQGTAMRGDADHPSPFSVKPLDGAEWRRISVLATGLPMQRTATVATWPTCRAGGPRKTVTHAHLVASRRAPRSPDRRAHGRRRVDGALARPRARTGHATSRSKIGTGDVSGWEAIRGISSPERHAGGVRAPAVSSTSRTRVDQP
jgi:hypothetical protein